MNRVYILILIIILQIGILIGSYPQYPSFPLKITFFDIGQGDSILVETENKEKILVDTGPDNRIVEKLTSKFSIINNSIDLLIITHPDMDHIGGMLGILENFNVKKIIYDFDLGDENSNYFQKLKQAVENENSIITNVSSDSDFDFDGCFIDFVWPDKINQKALSDNDSSISIKLDYHGFDIFLGGDISTNIEEKIENVVGKVEVMKLNHHGSNTSNSEEFLKILNPQIVIISVGKNNQYNHPSKKVLQELSEEKVEYYRTDEVGDVICNIKDEINFVCKPSFF